MRRDHPWLVGTSSVDELPTIGLQEFADSGQILSSAFWAQCLAIGEMVPEFVLPNAQGELVSLEEMLDAGPVVLSFQHEPACLCCEPQRRLLVEMEPDISGAGGSLAAIYAATAGTPPENRGLWSEPLYDPTGRVPRLFGLLCLAPTPLHDALRRSGMALPDPRPSGSSVVQARATYVVDIRGIVAYAAVSLGPTQTIDANVLTATLVGLQEATEAGN